MKIAQNSIDELNATIALTIEQSDYEPRVKKGLSEQRRKAEIKGFRPGMAPMSLIEKMYGKSILMDEIQKLLSEGLNQHITDNKLQLLGEPLPNEEDSGKLDLEKGGDLDFKFDIALAPSININFTEKDSIPFYKITVTKEDLSKYQESILRQHGKLENTETSSDEDFITATLTQGEHLIENTYISLKNIEDQQFRMPFIGQKVGDEIEVDVKQTFTNETDLAAMLKVKKEELADFEPVFKIKINEIKRFAPAELNQDLFDRIFGEDVVKNEEEFNQKAEERIASEYAQESNYRFAKDARVIAFDKANIVLPDNFLKRWLLYANEGKITKEQIDKDYEAFAEDLRWQMIRGYIAKEQKFEVTKEAMLEHARQMARYQFAMYGLPNVPDEHIDRYANTILDNEKEARNIYERAEDSMVMNYIKSAVTLEEKEITMEKMQELYEKEKK
ncbi:MAG: trigger factor [Bacteroidales bacterium]|nr:trigger factor [Bacteroidales bacterium]MCL2133524.1 trigger factor [Bacteroidales bacterium]